MQSNDEQMCIKTIRWYFRGKKEFAIVDEKFTDGDILEHLSDANFDIPVAIGTIKHWIATH